MAEFDHPATVATLLDAYPMFDPATRQDAVQTLSARASWALALVDAIAPIVEEAGGRTSAVTGESRLDHGSYVASNGLLHEELLRRLRG